MVAMTLADILEKLDHISDVWRADTSGEQRTDLSELDDLLGQLDEMEPETPAATERIDELRGRIEILMDEIEISLDIEPPPIFTPEDLDTEPP
jgi:hypothetical protein